MLLFSILMNLLLPVDDVHLNPLLDKPPTICCPLTVAGGNKVEPSHKLRQELCHLEERNVLTDAIPCTGTKL